MFDLFDGFLDLLGIGDADDDPADGADMLGGGASAQGVDLDGDGVPDVMMYQQEVDLDGDGIPDGMMYQQEVDLDGDGIPDGFMIQQDLDTDGDGQIDTTIYQQQLDTDGDGYVDTIQTETLVDLDGDMIADQYSMKVEQDTDGDGYMDYMTLQEDYDGDGIMDLEGEFADLDGDGFYEALDGGADSMLPGYDQNYDPALSDPDKVVGDPAEDMEDWHMQETNTSCAVASQEFVLENATGREFDEAALRDYAEEMGWYTPEGGTDIFDMGNILTAYGMKVEKGMGYTVDDIAQCLESGGHVIVAVDSSELWLEPDGEEFAPGEGADHAVQVIGIDYTDPDDPMVILNDSGIDDGCGAMVPLDTFMQAWEDSGCFMVGAYI